MSNTKRNIQRYILTVQQGDQEMNIQVEHNGEVGEKNFLSGIDLYTIRFDNKKDFLESLDKTELALSGIDNINKAQVYIKYQANKKTQKLAVAYSDKLYLVDYARDTKTEVRNEKAEPFATNFIRQMHRGTFWRYVEDNNLINKRLKTLLVDVVYDKKNFQKPKLIKELSNYKVIRRLLVGLEKYQFQEKKYEIYFKDIEDQTFEKVEDKIVDFGDEDLENLYRQKDFEEIYNTKTLDELESMGAIEDIAGGKKRTR